MKQEEIIALFAGALDEIAISYPETDEGEYLASIAKETLQKAGYTWDDQNRLVKPKI